MAVGASGNMGIEWHHVVEERCGILPHHGTGKHIHFIDETVPFFEERNELVGMAVLRHPEEKREDLLFYPVDFHGMLLLWPFMCCTDPLVSIAKKLSLS
jgi:hypothetical protein